MELLAGFLVFCMAGLGSGSGTCQEAGSGVFNVLDYGAVGDGIRDDSIAFSEVWSAACGGAVSEATTICIPEGRTFLLSAVNFQGPCKSSSINFQVYGNIVAPHIKEWSIQDSQRWLVFSNVDGLVVNGEGLIDGQGLAWWDQFNKLDDSSRTSFIRPTALAFENCHNLQLCGLTHINSPRNHISVESSIGVTISYLHITAPEESPNTDGIDIAHSSNIQIHDCVIETGDDCIAMNGGSANINITSVACGPGHGISIGSLGWDGATDTVEEIHVRNCSFIGSMFGARIKSWQGGSGYARHISFKDITLVAAATPIFIDQFYCISTDPCTNQTAAVQVSDVTYEGVQGTSITDEAIKLSCSETVGCTNIVLSNINIAPANPERVLSSSCLNAHGIPTATNPVVDCLLP